MVLWATSVQRAAAMPREAALVVAITLLAAAVRAAHVLQSDFPLNDGGMFAAAIDDIRATSFRLPTSMSYNQVDIPFAYPPLGFYVVAAIQRVTGLESITLLRVVPLIASILTVPAFYLVARNVIPRQPAMLGMAVFALLPRSFNWEIVGGGLTRSLGFFFAVLALHQVTRLLNAPRTATIASAGIFGGLCILAHMEMAIFLLVSAILLLGVARPNKKQVVSCVVAGAVSAVLALPWLAAVLLTNGIEPWLSASGTGESFSVIALNALSSSPFGVPFFPLFAALAFCGIFISQQRGHRWLVAWVVLLFVLDPRKAATVATVPVAMLAGLALWHFVLPLFATSDGRESESHTLGATQRLVLYGLFGFGLSAAILADFGNRSPLHALSAESREAAALVRQNSPPGARILVVSGEPNWGTDSLNEWLPYLAQRHSVATVQGYEWLGKDRYEKQRDFHRDVQDCASRGVACLQELDRDTNREFDYVLVAGVRYEGIAIDQEDLCCQGLRESLRLSPQWAEIFDHPDGTLFRRR